MLDIWLKKGKFSSTVFYEFKKWSKFLAEAVHSVDLWVGNWIEEIWFAEYRNEGQKSGTKPKNSDLKKLRRLFQK